MTLLFWLVDPLPQEPGKGVRLAGVQVVPAIQSQVIDIAALLDQLASQAMEFVIPAAGDPAHRQSGMAQPGDEIRLFGQRRGAQHGCDGRALVAQAAGCLAGTGGLVQIGEHPLPVPVCQDLGQGFALEAPGPALVVFEAGGALGYGRPGWQFSSKSACKPAGDWLA